MKKKTIAGITKVIPTLTVRTQLGQILEEVNDRQDRFLICKRGEAQAVILSVEDYLRNIIKRPDAIFDLQNEAKKKGLHELSMDEVDAEISAYRRNL